MESATVEPFEKQRFQARLALSLLVFKINSRK